MRSHRPHVHWTSWLALSIVLIVVISNLAGCAKPTRVVVFNGYTTGGESTSIIITVDIIFAPGVTSTIKYPQEFVVPKSPFTHVHVADIGTITHMSIMVVPTQKGQHVACSILVDGKIFDTGQGSYPRGAVCLGPPV